jgi:glutathione S-transferase
MTIAFYQHPFFSCVQKAKTAFYEKGMLFEAKMLDGSEPVASEFAALWPTRRFPVIVDDGQFVFEAKGIIEYLEAGFPETARLGLGPIDQTERLNRFEPILSCAALQDRSFRQ